MQKNLEKKASEDNKPSIIASALPLLAAGQAVMSSKKELREESKEGTPLGWAMDNPVAAGLLATMLAGYLKMKRDEGIAERQERRLREHVKNKKIRSFRQ